MRNTVIRPTVLSFAQSRGVEDSRASFIHVSNSGDLTSVTGLKSRGQLNDTR